MSIVSACRFMGIGSNVPHPRTLFSRRTSQRKARRKVRVGGMDIGILSCVCCRCRIFIKEKEVFSKGMFSFLNFSPAPPNPRSAYYRTSALLFSPDKSCLQFGKQDDDGCRFALDYRWPLSPVQAFGIFLSACLWVGPMHAKD